MPSLGVNTQDASSSTLLGAHPPVIVPITLATGENLKRGHVLGKITVGGQYAGYDNDLSTGVETARAILAEDTDATDAATPTIAYVHGEFNASALTWDDAANDKTAGIADLFAVGIFVK